MAGLCSLATYLLVVAVAALSAHFRSSMLIDEAQMMQWTLQSSILRKRAATNETKSEKDAKLAVRDNLRSKFFGNESVRLNLKAHLDEVYATNSSHEAEIFDKEASIEQGAAKSEQKNVTIDESIIQEANLSETKAISAAGKIKKEGTGDHIAVWICRRMPLFDFICNAIGGVVKVATKTTAANQTARVSAEAAIIAAEKRAKATAEAKVRQAEKAAKADASQGSFLRNETTSKEAIASVDQRESSHDAALARSSKTDGTSDETLAAKADYASVADTSIAETYMEKSFSSGMRATLAWAVAIGLATSSLMFFLVKLFLRAVEATQHLERRPLTCSICFLVQFQYQLSYILLHGCVFLCVMVTVAHISWPSKSSVTLDEGEFTVEFATMAAFTQTFFLHALPALFYRAWWPLCQCIGLFVFLTCLFALEALVLVVTFGKLPVGYRILSGLSIVPSWVSWGVLLVAIGSYLYVFFYRLQQTPRPEHQTCTENDRVLVDYQVTEKSRLLTETEESHADPTPQTPSDDRTASLSSDGSTIGSIFIMTVTRNRPHDSILPIVLSEGSFEVETCSDTVDADLSTIITPSFKWSDLAIPLELFAVSFLCTVVLATCLTHTSILWPLLRHWAKETSWLISVELVTFISVLFFCVCLARSA